MTADAGKGQVAPRPAFLRGYGRDFWLLFAATAAFNSAVNMFVLFPLFIVELGGRARMIGILAAFGSLASLASRPLVGKVIDGMGRRWAAVRFALIEGVAILLYAPIGRLGWPIFAVKALHGLADGSSRVALFAMVFPILPADRGGEGMAIFSLCGIGTSAFAPVLGELIIRYLGFTAYFCTGTLLCCVCAIVVRLVAENGRASAEGGRRAAALPVSARTPRYVELFLDPVLIPLWVVTFFFTIAIAVRVNFVAPFAYHEGVKNVGFYFSVYAIFAILIRLLGGRWIDRLGLARTLAPSLAVLGVGVGLLVGTGWRGVLTLAAAIGGLGHGYTYPALSALLIRRTEEGAMGRVSNIYTTVSDLAALSGPVLFGLFAQRWGYGPMFVAAGAATFGAAVYFFAVQPDFSGRLAP